MRWGAGGYCLGVDMNGDGVPDDQLLGATLHAELLRSGGTVSTAESMTGGALADLLSASPGASETFLGGVVSYATEIKRQEGRPVGMVFVAVAGPRGTRCEQLDLPGDRAEIRHRAGLRAAVLTLESISGVAV